MISPKLSSFSDSPATLGSSKVDSCYSLVHNSETRDGLCESVSQEPKLSCETASRRPAACQGLWIPDDDQAGCPGVGYSSKLGMSERIWGRTGRVEMELK